MCICNYCCKLLPYDSWNRTPTSFFLHLKPPFQSFLQLQWWLTNNLSHTTFIHTWISDSPSVSLGRQLNWFRLTLPLIFATFVPILYDTCAYISSTAPLTYLASVGLISTNRNRNVKLSPILRTESVPFVAFSVLHCQLVVVDLISSSSSSLYCKIRNRRLRFFTLRKGPFKGSNLIITRLRCCTKYL